MNRQKSFHPGWLAVVASNAVLLLIPAVAFAQLETAASQAAIQHEAASENSDLVPNTDPQALSFPPLPEHQQAPSLSIASTHREIDIQLINATNAPISYQSLGHTEVRTLSGDKSIVLRGLDMPATLTFQRQDGGLLQAEVRSPTADGPLILVLDETDDLDDSKVVMNVELTGQIFLN